MVPAHKALVVMICYCCLFLPKPTFAQIASKVILYNSAYDYFEGDRQEHVTHEQILSELKRYPPTYSLIGLGAVIQDNGSGAVIVGGTVRKPIFYQTTAEKAHGVKPLNPESFPWLQLAFCNPRTRMAWKVKTVRNIHQFIADQLQSLGNIKLAAVSISGMLSDITYSPRFADKASESVNHNIDSPQEWELTGLYFKEYELQLAGSKRGRPLILFGSDNNQKRGGYVHFASVVRANIFIYPLEEYKIKQSDLSITSIKWKKRVNLKVKNDGELGVRRVQLRMSFLDTTIEDDEKWISVPAYNEVSVEFNPPGEIDHGNILFKIDHDESVRELREDNNLLYFYLDQRR